MNTAIADIDVSKVPPLEVDMYGPEIKSDPSKWFLKWATQPPRFFNYSGHLTVIAARHDDVKRGLMDQECFSAVPVPGTGTDNTDYFNGLPIIVELDPPNHTRIRRLMQPAFTPRRVSDALGGINAVITHMVDQLEQRGTDIEVVNDIAYPFSTTILLGNFLALPQQDWMIFLRFSHALALVSDLKEGDPKPKEYMDAYNVAYQYCSDLIEDRRRTHTDDLLGGIIAAHDVDAKITTEELFATIMSLFAGGLGTIAATTALGMLRLGRNPDQMALLRQEPTLINSCIEEVLRIDCLGNFRHRWAKKDFEWEGLQIKKGTPIALSLGAGNYDPQLYPNPEKFDIRRAPTDISSFGYGIHFCIGQALARPAVRAAVLTLVQRFPKLRLAGPNFEPVWGGMPTERWPMSVPMAIT